MKELIEREYLPQALAIGVEYSLFYSLNPVKIGYFIEAYVQKQEVELDKIYLETWLSGQYILAALGTVLGESDYPKEPLTVEQTKKEEQQEAVEEKIKIKNEVDAIKFAEFAEAFNRDFRNKGGEG